MMFYGETLFAVCFYDIKMIKKNNKIGMNYKRTLQNTFYNDTQYFSFIYKNKQDISLTVL